MPNRMMDTLRRWKYPPRRSDRVLLPERPRDPRLPAEPDDIERQVADRVRRQAILKRLGS